MNKSLSTHDRRKELISVLAMIGTLFALLNIATVFIPNDLGSFKFKRPWPNDALSGGQDFDWIVSGDSIGNLSVCPDILQQKLGGEVFNGATYAGHNTLRTAWMVDHYLRKPRQFRGVIIVHGLHVWAGSGDDFSWAELPWLESFQLNPAPHIPFEKVVPLFLMRLLPLNRLSFAWPPRNEVLPPRNYWIEDRGHRSSFPRVVSAPDKTEPELTWLPGDISGGISKNSLRMLERLNKLALERNFEVFVALQPVATESLHLPEFAHKLQAARAVFSDIETRLQHVHLLNFSNAVPRRYFVDENHISYPGAVIYSNHLADALKDFY